MSDEHLLDLIQSKISDLPQSDIHITLNRAESRRDGNWLYAVVTPDPADVRLSRYIALLSQVENAIEDETNSHVVLVPTLVD